MLLDSYLNYLVLCFQDVPESLCIGLLVAFCLGSVLLLTSLGVKKGLTWSAALLLVEYAFLLLVLSVLSRPVKETVEYDFHPFWTYRAIHDGSAYLLKEVVANVVAFIPIGLLLGCVFGRLKWWQVVLTGAGFSVLIETLQFILKRGFTEFDDVFHNVLGCLIGYGLYRGIDYVSRRMRKRRVGR